MVQVLVADNQELALAGIQHLLDSQATLQVVGEVNHWEKLPSFLQQ